MSNRSQVTIAILDTGIAPADDLMLPKNRILATIDFVNSQNHSYDDNGHGTHVAGIAAGNGGASFGRYAGVNPLARLVSVKVLDADGRGSSGDALAGIQWIIDNKESYGIRVANLSIGSQDSGNFDPLVKAAEAAWDAGIVMVIAAGNGGPHSSSVTSPGISRKVITVGAYDDENCVDVFGSTLTNFSGRGPTFDCIVKPDILAKGCEVVSVLSNSPEMSPQRLRQLDIVMGKYVKMSGTSMAAPAVAGAVSLLLAKKPQLTPNEVKLALKHSAQDLGMPQNRQGWGKLDIDALLRL